MNLIYQDILLKIDLNTCQDFEFRIAIPYVQEMFAQIGKTKSWVFSVLLF